MQDKKVYMTPKGPHRYTARADYGTRGAGRANHPVGSRGARKGYTGIVRMGYNGHSRAERVPAARRRRRVAACMVEDAPRKGGAPVLHARHLAGARPVARRAIRPYGVDRYGAGRRGREKMRDLECGRLDGDSETGEQGLSLGESLRAFPDLHLAALSSYRYTQSNIFKFVTR